MPGVKGAVMSGVASGDMLGSCARGDIHSMTFIFNDGRISTTTAKGSDGSLGYISSQTGNPCIAGTFHSDAAIFLGAQMGLSAAQGYANAITSSQYMTSTNSEGETIHTLMGDANKAAIGQGGSAAAEAAQTWWNRRVQNSFDYVYVPNVNPKTGKPMKVVVNISKQIPINYDKNARKVSYENSLQNTNALLD
jgi:integrating conjugative element protein (TIGR03752 family)